MRVGLLADELREELARARAEGQPQPHYVAVKRLRQAHPQVTGADLAAAFRQLADEVEREAAELRRQVEQRLRELE
jgi:hypothetical protein